MDGITFNGGTVTGKAKYVDKVKGEMEAEFTAPVVSLEFKDYERINGIARTKNGAPIIMTLADYPSNSQVRARADYANGTEVFINNRGVSKYTVVGQKGDLVYVLGN